MSPEQKNSFTNFKKQKLDIIGYAWFTISYLSIILTVIFALFLINKCGLTV